MSSDLSLFNFNAEHNGVQCIASLNPLDAGTERAFWFTAQMLATEFGVGVDTIRRRVQTLANTGDIDETQNCVSLNILHDNGNGAVKTTIFDLTVLNKLAMTFIDNERAVEIRHAFNDILVKHETGITKREVEDALNDPDTMIALCNRWKQEKAMRLMAEAERDEAIRIKYHFIEGRDAKVCGELGGLRTQNEKLREQIGDAKRWKKVKAIGWLKDFFVDCKALYIQVGKRLSAICKEKGWEVRPIEDSDYGHINTYPVEAINLLHQRVSDNPAMLGQFRKAA